MLAKRIIPCLDITGGRVVKGVNFLNLKDAGDPIEIAKRYEKEMADELVYLDITASSDNNDILIDLVHRTSQAVFMPLTVGGGIRKNSDIQALLRAGADKISINSTAVKTPTFITQMSKRFGRQCIVVAIDAKKISPGKWEVFINGGRIATGKDAILWARQVQRLGAGEILLTSMDRDGTKDGYDLDLISEMTKSVNIPIIASGGAGKLEHFYQAFQNGADACLAASLFHYKELSISKVKKYLKQKEVCVR